MSRSKNADFLYRRTQVFIDAINAERSSTVQYVNKFFRYFASTM